jgi:hypothetical protein
MKVSAINRIEDCFDGSYIREIVLDEVITEETVRCFRAIGTLDYYPDFARPFFKVTGAGFSMKGVVGNSTIRLTITGGSPDDVCGAVTRAVEGEGGTPPPQ